MYDTFQLELAIYSKTKFHSTKALEKNKDYILLLYVWQTACELYDAAYLLIRLATTDYMATFLGDTSNKNKAISMINLNNFLSKDV